MFERNQKLCVLNTGNRHEGNKGEGKANEDKKKEEGRREREKLKMLEKRRRWKKDGQLPRGGIDK